MTSIPLLNWRFHLGDCDNAWYKGFDDSAWEEVVVPDDWSVRGSFSQKNSSGTGYLPGGTGWYRTSFSLTEHRKKVFACFDGAYKNSRVWINSNYLGERPSGYVPFIYDISEFIRFGEQNTLSVRLCHEDISDSRWFTGSGLYRKVYLLITEPVYSPPNELFFHTGQAEDGCTDIFIDDVLANDRAIPMSAAARYDLIDPDGKTTLSMNTDVRLEPGERKSVSLSGKLKAPRLWSCDSPTLYNLRSEIRTSESLCLNERPVGIRTIHFDPDNGFFLNGTETKLRGVCVHHDAGCLGAAVWPEVWQRRLEKLKAMGCNAIRMSHNPHMPELYDLCDRMGFLVIDEAFDEWEGAKNKWSTGHNVYPPKHQGYYEAFPVWHKADLTAQVKGNRNHPSIILWSIGNEIDYPNDPYCHPLFQTMSGNNDANKPEAERRYDPDKPNAERIAAISKKLYSIVKRHDTSRPVTAAIAFPELSAQTGFIETLDVLGYNYKERRYAQDHARFPAKPLLGSENTHDYQAWLAVRNNRYISGQFLWTGADYLGEAKGWPLHGSGAGLLCTAGFEKSGYYRRKSWWTEENCAYLSTARENDPQAERVWNYETGEMIRVFCHTNLKQAELCLNGKSLGIKHHKPDEEYIFWDIPYTSGSLTVLDGSKALDELRTCGDASKIRLTVWRPRERLLPSWPDYRFIQAEAELLDKNGNLSNRDNTLLTATVEGGALLGLDNGDLCDNTAFSACYRRARGGRLIIYCSVPNQACAARLTVSAEGLTETSVEI